MKIPGITVLEPQLPDQATPTLQPQLTTKTSRGGLIELGDVIDGGSVPGEDLLHRLSQPNREVAA